MKKFIFETLTKLENLGYASVILLWMAGAVLTICGFPWITLAIIAMHITELFTIGLATYRATDEKLFYCVAMCMLFGFFWWIPLRTKTGIAKI